MSMTYKGILQATKKKTLTTNTKTTLIYNLSCLHNVIGQWWHKYLRLTNRYLIWLKVYSMRWNTYCHFLGNQKPEWRFYVGKIPTSSCSLSCVGDLFTNGALLSVCGEQPIVMATAWVVCEFLWESFTQQISWMKYNHGTKILWWQEMSSRDSVSLLFEDFIRIAIIYYRTFLLY